MQWRCFAENEVARILSGAVSPSERTQLESHLDGCPSCRLLIAHVSAIVPLKEREPTARGEQVDRYWVLEPIGVGGMGIVFAAYDPELDRKIALKLVRPERDEGDAAEARPRLLSEGKALARLSHPNVVSVYDAGTWGDEVFLAMELVQGRTLRAWIRSERPPFRSVLLVLRQAGQGLAAAHAAGLVHRDFKPENVLVGDDGRVRVGDFGLAHAGGELGASGGTPAYMSPEQRAGREVDARSDQYSFCVVAQEMLGEGSGDSHSGRTVPRHLERVLRRGLEEAPERRFETMTALLDALSRPSRTVQRVTALTVAGALVLLTAGLWSMKHVRYRACLQAQSRVDALSFPERVAAVREALAGETPVLTAARRNVERRLRDASRLYKMNVETSCAAFHLRGSEDAQVHTERTRCLSEEAEELETAVDALAQSRGPLALRSAQAFETMAATTRCEPGPALLARARHHAVPSPLLEKSLVKTRAYLHSAQYAKASELASTTLEKAQLPGQEPHKAAALWLLGEVEHRMGKLKTAESRLLEAAFLSHAQGLDELEVQSWIQLGYVSGYKLGKIEEGRRNAELAKAALHRLGGDAPLELSLAVLRGTLAIAEARYRDAEGPFLRAVELAQRGHGAPLASEAHAQMNLGNVLSGQGRHREAEAAQRRALELARAWAEGDHPRVATLLVSLAATRFARGDLQEANRSLDEALAMHGRVHPKDDPGPALALTLRAEVKTQEGALDEALALLEDAEARLVRRMGPDNVFVVQPLVGRGETLLQRGDDHGALMAFRRATEVVQKVFGAKHFFVAQTLFGVGEAHKKLGRFKEARHALEQSVSLFREQGAHLDPYKRARAVFSLATLLRQAGAFEEALALGRESLTIMKEPGADPSAPRNPQLTAQISDWLAREQKRMH